MHNRLNKHKLLPENGEPSACWLVVNEFAHLVALPPMATTLSSLSGHVATVGELAQILHLSELGGVGDNGGFATQITFLKPHCSQSPFLPDVSLVGELLTMGNSFIRQSMQRMRSQ